MLDPGGGPGAAMPLGHLQLPPDSGPPAPAYSNCTPVGRVRFRAPTELPASPTGGLGPLGRDHQSNRKEVQPRLPGKASLF